MNEALEPQRDWALISNHGAVLLFVAIHSDATVRSIARAVGITERQVARILKDLIEGRVIDSRRIGRRNVYAINPDARFRHPLIAHMGVARLLDALTPGLAPAVDGRD